MREFFKYNINKVLALGITLIIVIFIHLRFFTIISPEKYLSDNNEKISLSMKQYTKDNDMAYVNFKLLNSSVKDNKIFLTAHDTYREEAYKFDMELFKYLKANENIKYYLMSVPYSSTYFLNKYLESGREEYLSTFLNMQDTELDKRFLSDYINNLYELNKTFSKEKKIKVLGIGKEEANKLYFALSTIENNGKLPSNMKEIIDSMEVYIGDRVIIDKVGKGLRDLEKYIDENEEEYAKAVGEDAVDFKLLIKNGLEDIEYLSSRDEIMYNNFLRFYEYLPEGKYFGGLEGKSAYQKRENREDFLGAFMNEKGSPVKEKVVTIAYIGDRSTSKTINKISKKQNTLFKLIGRRSPFRKYTLTNIFPNIDSEGYWTNTTDYFQFVLKI